MTTSKTRWTVSSLPPEITLEAVIAPGVALYDASKYIQKVYPRKRSRKAIRPPKGNLEALFVHHSGSLGRDEVAGFMGAVRFVMQHRGFPGAPYHFWVSHDPDYDEQGNLIIWRLAEDSYRAWHSGNKANDMGLGLCLQGNLTRHGMSAGQEEALEAFLPWVSQHYDWPWEKIKGWLGWHAIAGRWGGRDKKACPSPKVEAWLRAYISRT